ncbi:fumarylacetoacetate hydrolase family protein [Puniceicoccus vermicola]|uniref:Fumarylacetoacetate hydrolase family protein n=1 Tax=Puniceicoccus vermicola TaxID=388746 RepID=A0A7X1B3T7_9BACT|nr:fumarylacetoacetate hydrolase family protein [Puniceicoccus vermicola]MBC2604003.1 fumarylacetoacetate hydrolase family protein [Puniceicoccus vermicola]
MRIARILTVGGPTYAVQHAGGGFSRLEGDLFGDLHDTGEAIEGSLLTPLVPPTIYCIGLNYRAHAEETGKKVPEFPVVFMKSPTALQHPEKPIILPDESVTQTVDYEAELTVIIGKDCKNVSREKALEVVFGYTCSNDVSARNWQTPRGGGQFCRAKTFDTFCPLGPVIVTADEIRDPGQLRLSTTLNGKTMQDSKTEDLIFDVPALIEFLSKDTTLAAGTIILTGTPQGVGVARDPAVYLKDGDVVEISIEGIGSLRNPVQAN